MLVAYTYDWGMVTDLARRNISRICAQLGVEHILVSADIVRKREHIRKNVLAWLKRPNLAMIPLFMAGDKQYYYYLKKVREQLGVGLSVLGENMLERTHFKTGFANIAPYWDPNHVYTLPSISKIKLFTFYARQYLTIPRTLIPRCWTPPGHHSATMLLGGITATSTHSFPGSSRR